MTCWPGDSVLVCTVRTSDFLTKKIGWSPTIDFNLLIVDPPDFPLPIAKRHHTNLAKVHVRRKGLRKSPR